MTPVNASDVQHFSPQHSQQQSLFANSKLNLRTPSSFIPKSLENQTKSHLPFDSVPIAYKEDVVRSQQLLASQEKNPHHPARYHHVLKNIPTSTNTAQHDTVQGVYSKGSGLYNSKNQPLLGKCTSNEIINLNFSDNEGTLSSNVNDVTKSSPKKLEGRVENIGKYFDKNLEFSQGLLQTSRSQAQPFYNCSLNETTNQDKISSECNLLPSELKYSRNPSLIANSEDVQAEFNKSGPFNSVGSHSSRLNNYDLLSDKSTPFEIKPIQNSSSIINSEPMDINLVHQSINSLPHRSQEEKINFPSVKNLEFSSNLPLHLMPNQNLSETLLNNLDIEKAKDTLNRELQINR